MGDEVHTCRNSAAGKPPRSRAQLYRRRAAALVYVTVGMTVFAGFVSLGVDVAHVRLVKVELQTAADAAARYGASGLATSTTQAQNNAVAAAADNYADGTSVVVTPSTDIAFGTWSSSTGAFTVLSGAAISSANAIRVTASRTSAKGNAVSVFFARILGFSTMNVSATSTASYSSTQVGLFGITNVNLSGNAVSSYYSATGSAGGSAQVGSNEGISLSGSAKIAGNAIPGPGYSVSMSGGSSVTGSTSPAGSTQSFPNASAGSAATTNNDANAGALWNSSNNDFSIGGGTTTLPSGTYYFRNFTVSGGTNTNLNFSGPATVYVTGQINLSGSVNTYNNLPANLNFQVIGSGNVTVSGGGSTYSEIYAPQSSVTVSGSGIFYGSIVGSTLTGSGSAQLVNDLSLTSGGVATVQ